MKECIGINPGDPSEPVPASPPATGKDTSMQDAAVCPYCGHEHNSSDLSADGLLSEDEKVIACWECGKDFRLIGSASWYFSTYPTDPVPASPRETVGTISGPGRVTPEVLAAANTPVASGTPKEEWWDKMTQLLHDEFPLLWEAQLNSGGYNLWEDFFKRAQQECFPLRPPTPAEQLTNPSTLAGNVNNPGVDFDVADAEAEAAADSRDVDASPRWGEEYHRVFRANVNAQVRALVDAAVSKAREPLLAEIAAIAKAADEDDHALLGLSIVWIGGDDGDVLHDEYLTWYKPSEWPLGEHRAVSAFLAGKFRAYTCLRALVAEWQEARKAHRELGTKKELAGSEVALAFNRLNAAEAALAAWRKP